MPIDPTLAALAEKLIANKRHVRNDLLRDDLWRRQREAAGKGTLGAGDYARSQMDACEVELGARADAIWTAYRRVIVEARVAWSVLLRDEMIERIRSDIEGDIGYIEEMARSVIVPHGHGFQLFLRDAWPNILERAEAEIDVFGLKQRAVVSSLDNQLSSPRYAGPAAHWRNVQSALSSDPPDLASAALQAVHTMEGLAKIIAARPTATFGECVKALRTDNTLRSDVAKQLEMLWGLSSNLEGVRHGAGISEGPTEDELLFVAESAEAVVRLLLRLDGRVTERGA